MKRSKITQFPREIREWLDAELVRRGFADYVALAADLKRESAARGTPIEIGKSSIHRYGSKLERRLESINVAVHAANMVPQDDAGKLSGATISIVETDVFNTMVNLQDAETEPDPAKRLKLLALVAKNIATLSRASVHQKKHEIEVRGKVQAASDRAARIGKKGGLSAGAVEEIRREILGIAA